MGEGGEMASPILLGSGKHHPASPRVQMLSGKVQICKAEKWWKPVHSVACCSRCRLILFRLIWAMFLPKPDFHSACPLALLWMHSHHHSLSPGWFCPLPQHFPGWSTEMAWSWALVLLPCKSDGHIHLHVVCWPRLRFLDQLGNK